MSLLEFRGAGLQYHSRQENTLALEGIDLQISEGEFVTIVGPSGCGKSSLLNLAAGIQFPTTGTILFRGEPIVGPDWKRGIMLQHSTLFPWLNVAGNVAFGLKVKGMGKKERLQLANNYLQRVGLQEFANHYPFELSGGMKQRAALARTLINEPDLVLMDEPFGALDAFTKRKMQALLSNIRKETKKTFLFVTHDVEEAIKLGTRIVVLSPRPGTIIADLAIDRGINGGGAFEDSQEFKRTAHHVYQLLSDCMV